MGRLSRGDFVLSTERSVVADTFRHDYDGDMVTVCARGCFPVVVTPNHPLLVARLETKYNRRGAAAEHAKSRERVLKDTSWVEAGKIRAGDYLVFPQWRPSGTSRNLDMSPHIGKNWTKNARFKAGVPLSPEIAELLGFYAGNGSCSKAQVEIDFNPKTEGSSQEAQRLARIIEGQLGYRTRVRAFHATSVIRGRAVEGTCGRVAFGGEALGRLLRHEVKRSAHDVSIPWAVMDGPEDVRSAFVYGYMMADGHHSAGRAWEATSVCRSYIEQLQLLLSSLGTFSPVRATRDGRFSLAIRRSFCHKRWGLGGAVEVERGSPSVIDERNIYVKVSAVGRERYCGEVCNIETAARHYRISNVLAHNSVRRGLVLSLRRAGAGDMDIARFMRWSGGGQRGGAEAMVDWYGDPTAIVGEEAEARPEEREGTREEDARVWDAHPWLGLWR